MGFLTVFDSHEYHRMKPRFLDNKAVMAAAVVLTVLAVAYSACDSDEVEAPEDVATSFLSDLRQGERQAAMDSIWPPTRRKLQEAGDELDELTDGQSPVETSQLLAVTRLESPFLISSIDARNEVPEQPDDGDEVQLVIEFRDDRSAELPVRWKDDHRRWYVDLPIDERRPLEVPAVDDEDNDDDLVEDEDRQETNGEPDELMDDE